MFPNVNIKEETMSTKLGSFLSHLNISEWTIFGEDTVQVPMSEQDGFPIIAFICSLIMIVCSLVGSLGNIMSILIFTRLSMRRLSVNVLLAGLSSVDLVIVVLAVPVYAVNGLNDYLVDRNLYENFYSTVLLILYPICMVAQTCSIWTFVLISVERYIAVCRPLVVRRFLSVGRARLAQFLLLFLAVIYNFVRFFEYGSSSDWTSGYYQISLRENRLYFVLYYTSLYLLTHFLIPFTIITTLNVLILRRLRRARQERQRLSHAQLEQCRTTRMITLVTVLFSISNFLPFIVNLWEALDPNLFNINMEEDWVEEMVRVDSEGDTIYSTPGMGGYSKPVLDVYSTPFNIAGHSKLSTSIAYLILDISNTIVVANAASTFLIYLVYCKRYRRLFWAYCRCVWMCRKKSGLSMPNNTITSNWSSYALRPYSNSMDPISASHVTMQPRSRSNCIVKFSTNNTTRRGTTPSDEDRPIEMDRLHAGRASTPASVEDMGKRGHRGQVYFDTNDTSC